MDSTSLGTLIDFSIVETLLILIISFVGAFGHEFMQFMNQNKRITISVWGEIFITTIVVSIISLAINPFITAIHPRLILLPPLLLSLLGEELLNKLIHIDKSSKLFITVLKFLHVKIPDNVELPEAADPKDSLNRDPARHKELLKEIISVKVSIEEILIQFEETKDERILLSQYKDINTSVALIKLRLRGDPDVEDVLVSEYKNMLDHFGELCKLRKDAIADGHISYTDTTSSANTNSIIHDSQDIHNKGEAPMRIASSTAYQRIESKPITQVKRVEEQNKESVIDSSSIQIDDDKTN